MSRIVTKTDVINVIDNVLLDALGKTQAHADDDLLKLMIIDQLSTELALRMPLTFTWKVGCELSRAIPPDALVTVDVISGGVVSTTIQRRYSEACEKRYGT